MRKFSDYLYEQKFKLIDFNDKNEEAEEKVQPDEDQDKLTDKDDTDDKEKDDRPRHNRERDKEHKHHKHHEEHKKEKKEDPDRQGVIRTIKNAHLVYKRSDSDGTFSELWMYDISKGSKDEFDIRNAILDGTDIDQKTGSSDDNKQKYTLWTNNTRQMMHITGLAN
jgi:hypothetical protein